ncbi:hypothetical protein [Fructobacillus evanidus]|uniref:Uncharacterized protein n=1 Tax=Fructobacillus evanidus TaxID=3064281 RepID=A0ABM9MWZ6_9LACO|nr:unnamed protein product [Fructobacillus sp. LMG 32999]CAK1229904.1 unnamed protein product [Fructobacillus sp. LMG 32999]CAK1230736.1 unnamed protein product [Fructobacillus sp. LMG 32999]CAK1230803.1 unnamed protein product [Fructobacillus sp. LMG 32999]CAK1231939.1 unnamed protein product [Fructobacillus sp. LMG 32999]
MNNKKEQLNLLIWLIETRCPNLYKQISSVPHTPTLKNDIELQAQELLTEYEIELNDQDVDRECLYKKSLIRNSDEI